MAKIEGIISEKKYNSEKTCHECKINCDNCHKYVGEIVFEERKNLLFILKNLLVY